MSPESKPIVSNYQTILKDAETKMQKALDVVSRDFSTVRTGRANPALLEGVRVEYYGTPTPLKQVASLSAPDPKLLIIQPWDIKSLPEIEKDLLKSDLGLSRFNDGKIIRISVPSLSTERREELTRVVHKQAEEGRIALRNVRHSAKEGIEKLFKDKTIAEDDKFTALDALQTLTDRYQAKIEEMLASKEAELKVV